MRITQGRAAARRPLYLHNSSVNRANSCKFNASPRIVSGQPQAALLKARQLMAEYKLTEAELHEGNKKIKTIKTSISCTKQTNFWIFTLSTVISENYCCQAVHERAKHSKTYFIGFVGLEEDVSICVNIFTYAVDCVLTQIQNLKQTYCNLSLGAQKKNNQWIWSRFL